MFLLLFFLMMMRMTGKMFVMMFLLPLLLMTILMKMTGGNSIKNTREVRLVFALNPSIPTGLDDKRKRSWRFAISIGI